MNSERDKMRHYTKRPKPLRDTPRPPMPVRLRPGADRGQILIELDGHVYGSRILQPGYSAGRAPRSDQVSVQIDGHWLTMSMRAAALAVVAQIPRRLTQREMMGLE